MAELSKLKELEVHIAALQRIRAEQIGDAIAWSQLRVELERILPGPNSDLENVDSLVDQELVEKAKRMAEEAEFWEKLRGEIEKHRLRIRAELEAYRSRKHEAGKGTCPRDSARASVAEE